MNIRNANGLSVGGGRIIGKMVAICGLNAGGGGGRCAGSRIGWRGVPNAGEDENGLFSCSFCGIAMLQVYGGVKAFT